MLDYGSQRSLPTISKPIQFVRIISITFMFLSSMCLCVHGFDSQSFPKPSLQKVFKARSAHQTKRSLRVIYFREFDMTIDENRLKNDIKNLTESYEIDLKIKVFNQSTLLLSEKLCSLIAQEKRDTIIIADLYTKEIDLISRSLKMPTIATTNRYQIVQGKQHNPYLFKLMPDAVEEAKAVAYALDTRSVYTRIALIYDISIDMVEYRLSYLRLTKQHIIYRAHLPRISLLYDLNRRAAKIIADLKEIKIDLILCIMSTERELQFIRLIKKMNSASEMNLLLNKTSWWFASRLGDIHNSAYLPKIYTANEDRRRLLGQFESSSIKVLLHAVIRTYIRIPISSLSIGAGNCATQQNTNQLRKTDLFIKLFTNFTEWSCEIRIGSGVDPILFEPDTLVWRVPTIFWVHTEHTCQGMLFRVFYSTNNNAEQLFRSCRPISVSSRKSSTSAQSDNSSTVISSSNALVDIKTYHQMFGKLSHDSKTDCRFVHIQTPLQTPVIVGVVEPPYIFISDAEISSEFHCNYGIHCYQIDPLGINFTTDALFFHSKMTTKPHCCYGISINLLLRFEDSKLVIPLKATKLFVFLDKPNKWLALTQTLQNRRAHLSISAIPYESFLARSIDLSPPFYHSSYAILTVPTTTGPSLGAFLQPFSWTTWCMIFLVLNVTALFEVFFEWHSPYGLTPRGRRRHKIFSLASALTLGWSVIFSHTFKTKSPKCWSNRFLGNVWGGFGIVFIAIYTAKLAAFMVDTGRTHSASTIQGIVDDCRSMPRCTVGVVANTSDEEYLKRFHSYTLYRHIQYVSSYGQGIDLLRSHVITYLLMDHSMARYYLTRDVFKLIRMTDDNFGTFGLSLGFSKFETDLKENITNILLSYVDKGIIQRLHDDWYVYENCETKLLNENRVLSVDRFFGVFILLIAGMLVGFLILLLEWLIFKFAIPYWRKRQWPGWLFLSQRMYAVLNVSNDLYNKAYATRKYNSFTLIGERLHNYSTRRDSLDLHVVDVPKLLTTTYQLKERIKIMNEQEQQMMCISPNGDLRSKKENYEKFFIQRRIRELEQELKHLRSQLIPSSSSDDL
ncbi:unnamed protein product [Rotaria magnacalcarata]|uniref:Ionotropic glutamate receptor C-terminal domain-containing protein n=6 Tax=Rotaria magnacalcarata TaxID=392030 RepID=A0A818WQP5_9BILA|nr:unnamed protein product [Rotaria magnacalcarata]CAF1312371.1 unnamed protein product [Rotaria magnacalcarata]CAF1986708.1 unnamed protein product [Rotaria magnacalcarata]CAF2134404.1 unnamed protein product [Rotaria magnacalcarata]CAF3727168.1 unnamed protein product [Rotaria magnacalcarata]